MQTGRTLVHGTCVAIAGRAALLRGPSGSGKSDLALRFLSAFADEGAVLIADDQVSLAAIGGRLMASAPPAIAGKIEVRGIGILAVPHVPDAELCLFVDLCAPGQVPRLPPGPPETEPLLGVAVPRIGLSPFEGSAPVKLKLALVGHL